jgi:hypothetical protein
MFDLSLDVACALLSFAGLALGLLGALSLRLANPLPEVPIPTPTVPAGVCRPSRWPNPPPTPAAADGAI